MTRRITRAILLVVVLAVVSFALPLAYAVARFYHDEEALRLERVASLASRDVSMDTMRGGDPIDLPLTDPAITLGLYSVDGVLVAGSGPPAADTVTAAALGGTVADGTVGGELVVALPISTEETVNAVARAAVPEDVVSDRIHRAWSVMLGLGGIVVTAAGLLAIVEGRRLSRPVQHLALAATRLGDGDFTVVVPASGVAEIDETGQALEATAARLGAMLERERAFTADVSHQLRTPVTGLRLRIESALATSTPPSPEVLRRVLDDVDRLETTIDDLVTLTRDRPSTQRSTAVGPVLDDLEPSWRGVLAAQARPLTVQLEPGVSAVMLSEAALRQVLEVLMDNATAHGKGRVTVTVRRVPGGAAIDVIDEGRLPPGDVERLFERRSPAAAGSGIGLALARSLAEAEGARVIAREHEGRTHMTLLATTAVAD